VGESAGMRILIGMKDLFERVWQTKGNR
jgi:hypothetical protein